MIEIISHGRDCQPKYKATCCYCGCVFKYNDNDRHGYDCLHQNEYVTCPECYRWLRHHYSKIIKEK